MRHRIATALISLAAVVGMLHSSVLPAAACSCAPLAGDEQVLGIMDYYNLVVEGHLADYSDRSENIRFVPEVLYHGELPDEIVIDQTWDTGAVGAGTDGYSSLGADCSYTLLGEPGDRYVLFLGANPYSIPNHPDYTVGAPGTYRPAGCASFALEELNSDVYLNYSDGYEAIKRVSNGGTVVGSPPPTDDNPPAELMPTPTVIDAVPISAEEPTPSDDAVLEQAAAGESDDDAFPWTAVAAGGAGLLAAGFVVGGLVIRSRRA